MFSIKAGFEKEEKHRRRQVTLDLVPSWRRGLRSLISNIFKPTNLSPKECAPKESIVMRATKKNLMPEPVEHYELRSCAKPWRFAPIVPSVFCKVQRCLQVHKYSLVLIPRISLESTSSISRIYTWFFQSLLLSVLLQS